MFQGKSKLDETKVIMKISQFIQIVSRIRGSGSKYEAIRGVVEAHKQC